MGSQPEKRLNTIPYIPVYGHCMPLYGSNLSEYGNIRDHIQAFFALWEWKIENENESIDLLKISLTKNDECLFQFTI